MGKIAIFIIVLIMLAISCNQPEKDSGNDGKGDEGYDKYAPFTGEVCNDEVSDIKYICDPKPQNCQWERIDNGKWDMLYDVWGASESDIYIGGNRGLLLHFDGDEWKENSIPYNAISHIWGESAENIFAIAWTDKYLSAWNEYGPSPVILHYTGEDWTSVELDPYGSFWYMFGTSGTNVYVVDYHTPAIWHYDGKKWGEMPNISGLYEYLEIGSIWGMAEDFLVAPATVFYSLEYIMKSFFLIFDGSTWKEVGETEDWAVPPLFVWGNSSDDIFGIGGCIVHYDGNALKTLCRSTYDLYTDVWGVPGPEIFASGENGTIARYDGNCWSVVFEDNRYKFFGVWASSESDVYAVGSDNANDCGVILHCS